MKKLTAIIVTAACAAVCVYGQASLESGVASASGKAMWYRVVVTNNTYTFTNDSMSPVSVKAFVYTAPAGELLQFDVVRNIVTAHTVTNVVQTNDLGTVVTNAIPKRWNETTSWTNRFTNSSTTSGSVYYAAPDGVGILGGESYTLTWTNDLDPRYLEVIYTLEKVE